MKYLKSSRDLDETKYADIINSLTEDQKRIIKAELEKLNDNINIDDIKFCIIDLVDEGIIEVCDLKKSMIFKNPDTENRHKHLNTYAVSIIEFKIKILNPHDMDAYWNYVTYPILKSSKFSKMIKNLYGYSFLSKTKGITFDRITFDHFKFHGEKILTTKKLKSILDTFSK